MKRQDSYMSQNGDKKQKVDEESQQLFSTVGEQAENIDHEDSQGLRKTGAEDAEGHPVQEIESLCMNCHETGTTRLLLTRIPFFREIIIMSFSCPHCGFRNSEIQPAAQVAEKGSRYTLKIEDKKDFNRQVVKSETATCKFTQLDIEIPPKRGQLTNVEGLLSEMVSDLDADQAARKEVQPEIYEKINEVIERIKAFLSAEPGTLPLHFSIDDPAGNSWIEFIPGEPNHKWSQYEYHRSVEQNVNLGFMSADDVKDQHDREIKAKKVATSRNIASFEKAGNDSSNGETNLKSTGFISDETEIENLGGEIQTFHATCSNCYKPCETHMKTIYIPHFKDVIIMSTVCEHCGFKSNEVKTGGEIPKLGRKVTLKVIDAEDLARDLLKSETCGLSIPELNLDLTPGTLGGRFTTVEGLLSQVYEELYGRVFTESSDSMDDATKTRWTSFLAKLQDAIDGKIKFTIIMEDPLASSYIQNVYAPDNDPNMTIEDFERNFEQNESLGLNDMKTD